jgi:hypothetical protein
MNTGDPEGDKRLDSLVDTIMKNTEQVRKINDELYNNKLLDLFKSKIACDEKEVSFDEFSRRVSELHGHEHHHDHDDHEHNHDH